jgi:hypothetical protein
MKAPREISEKIVPEVWSYIIRNYLDKLETDDEFMYFLSVLNRKVNNEIEAHFCDNILMKTE